MAEIHSLSPAANSNIGRFPEGMLARQVNDSARDLEAMLARYFADISGTLVSTGANNSYSLVTSRSITGYFQGLELKFRASFEAGGPASLNVNGLGPKPIRKNGTEQLDAGDIRNGQIVHVIFDVLDQAFALLNPTTPLPAAGFAVGDIKPWSGSTVPQGWLLADGGLVRVVDYPALFNAIGTSYGGDGFTHFRLPDFLGDGPDGSDYVILVDQRFSTGLSWATAGWTIGTFYSVGAVVQVGAVLYVCTAAHTATAATEPGVGADWQTVWGYLQIAASPASVTYEALDATIQSAIDDVLGHTIDLAALFTDTSSLRADLDAARVDIDAAVADLAAITTDVLGLDTALDAEIAGRQAAVASVQAAFEAADLALAGQITTVLASVSANSAAITTETAARVAGDDALAGQITTIEASVAANAAAITTEQIARADADTALAANIATVETSVGTTSADVTVERIARSEQNQGLSDFIFTGSAAVGSLIDAYEEFERRGTRDVSFSAQITTLTANYDSVSASLTAEQITRASENAALSASIDTLTTSVADNTASITTLTTSVNGIEAEWGVSVNVNGEIVGAIRLNGSASESTFDVVADTFRVARATGQTAQPVFAIGEVDGVTKTVIRGDVIADGSIIARNLTVGTLSAISANLGAITAGTITSLGYAEDASGNPTAGWKMDAAGEIRAFAGRFAGTIHGATISAERTITSAHPVIRNGLWDRQTTLRVWGGYRSSGTYMQSGTFERTPDQITSSDLHLLNGTNLLYQPGYFINGLLGSSMVIENGNFQLHVNAAGDIIFYEINPTTLAITTTEIIGRVGSHMDWDPLNAAARSTVYGRPVYRTFNTNNRPSRPPFGQIFDIVVPSFATRARISCWGAGGGGGNTAGGTGGAGGFARGNIAVTPGDVWRVVCGQPGWGSAAIRSLGFGGAGSTKTTYGGGGGLSGVFLGEIKQSTALVVAGGGGGAARSLAGGSGGSTVSGVEAGYNGLSGDTEIMRGLDANLGLAAPSAGGGGGYVGGGALPAESSSGNKSAGRGGTNYVIAGATEVISSASARGTVLPPQTADGLYTAIAFDVYAWGLAGYYDPGSSSTDVAIGEGSEIGGDGNRGGCGMVVIEWIA